MSCSELSSELQDCVGDHARMVPVTDTVQSLCDSLTGALRTCDETIDVSTAEEVCLIVARLYSDPCAAALTSCFDDWCNSIDRCLVNRADDFDIDAAIGVFSPETAPRQALTISGLIRRLHPVYAQACACSGECTANPIPSDELLACYDEVYRMNQSLHQPAVDCYERAMIGLEACLESALTMTECSACRGSYNRATFDCPDLMPDSCG